MRTQMFLETAQKWKRGRQFAVLFALMAVIDGAVSTQVYAHDVAPPKAQPPGGRQVLMTMDLPEVPGKRATVITVTYAPGEESKPHFHPGSVFAYVLRGSVVSQLDNEQPTTYTQGQFWHERPKQSHLVSRNASATDPAQLLVFLLSDKGEQVTVPIK